MPASPPPPPPGHAEALLTWVRRLCEEVGPSPRAMAPLPVYAAGRADVTAGRLLLAARLVLWRSFLRDAHGVLRALDLAPPQGAGGAWTLGGLARGDAVDALHAALAASRPHGDAGDEVRLLLLASPPCDAVWLHGEKADLLLPARDLSPALRAGAPCTPAQALAVLGPRARELEDEGP